jgi:POT family proton-dependent oligopeptide transporter
MFKGHPSGLKFLFFTEMWERFGFYLMLGIFSLYMLDSVSGGLAFSREWAAEVYGSYIALVYLTPFIGGIVGDRYLGYRKSIVLGGLLMAAGYLGLAAPGLTAFYVSLGLIILGNGFFKPNISTLVGRLYPAGSPLKDSGYNIFYMGINIGAFVCNFVAAILRNRYGWGYAFAAGGVGMLIGVVIFLLGQKHLRSATDRGDGAAAQGGVLANLAYQVLLPAVLCGWLGWKYLGSIFGSAQTAGFVAACLPVVAYYVVLCARAPRHERGPISAILAMCGVVIVFWMISHQNGSSLTYWAEENTRREAGSYAQVLKKLYVDQDATIGVTIEDPNAQGSYWRNVAAAQRPAPGQTVTLISTELFQSINPFFVVVLTPVVVAFFTALRRRGLEPSTPGKIAWGMVVTAVSTLLMIAAVRLTHGGETKASPWWLVGTYAIITIGELFLSPMGLSMVSKLAPVRVTSLMMGCWFLATAIGNKLAGVLAGFWEKMPIERIFWINCASALLAGLAIAALVPWIRRVIAEHESGIHHPAAAPGKAASARGSPRAEPT